MALLLVGCVRSGPDVEYVEGTIHMAGQPLAGATISFSPAAGSAGLPAYALTDANGVYRLTAAQGGRFGGGTTVGEYVVTVSKVINTDEPLPIEDPNDPRYGQPTRPSSPRSEQNQVPEIFRDVQSSPLRASVTAQGSNKFDFVLE